MWTVFRGTEPEAFAVEVTGVLRNALAVLGVSAPQRMDREQPALETA